MKKALLLLTAAAFLLAACASEQPAVKKEPVSDKEQADQAIKELNKELEKK